ncbi:hypothetical protein [Alkalihalobacillus sp. BA299]|uniref:hypothetical protein n=1 Tax=Alkalihalobacillus sp. BA299 TaxID=2815938 RepID=UPI001AD9C159|nr:hypothetical protein [Alkalihalobacillus sp. BA299]
MEKLCGSCSKNKGISKEERMKIAMSRLPGTVYICPECNEEHMLQHAQKVVDGKSMEIEELLIVPEEEKSNKKKNNSPHEQLSLF